MKMTIGVAARNILAGELIDYDPCGNTGDIITKGIVVADEIVMTDEPKEMNEEDKNCDNCKYSYGWSWVEPCESCNRTNASTNNWELKK